MLNSKGSEESNLDRLIKAIDTDKYNKRKRENDLEDEEIADNFDLLEDTDEESDVELEFKGKLIEKDVFNTFNEDYETFLSSNSKDLVPVMIFDHPLFSSYKVKNVTPLMKSLLTIEKVPDPLTCHSEYFINAVISKRLNTLAKGKKLETPPDSVKYLFSCLNSYVDVFYLNNRIRDLDSVRFVYALHIANHLVKSSVKKKESKEERTEGFTRPKILVICGLRCIAKDVVTNLLKLIPASKSNVNLDRFQSDFSLSEEDLRDQEESYAKTKKAKDFIKTFTGNQDDAFKIGIRYESGLLHLYSPFYSSDIIIASPLGLRPLISGNELDYDFLSSIEVLVVDRLDIIKFQNWRLFTDLFKMVNKPLMKWRDGDINKIRMSVIDGQIEEYRQNILISSSRSVIFNSFFKNLRNKRGNIRLCTNRKTDYIRLGTKLKIQQMFIKVPSSNIKDSHTETVKYFMENMLANLEDINGVLVILSDYTQYFSLSKRLKASNVQYLTCLESDTPKQMKFARQQFQSKDIPMMITTLRLLFFKRYLFKGTSKIFLLEPPEYPQLYKDLMRMVDPSRSNTIVCYYTSYHAMVLEPIVGTRRIAKLINAPDTKITQFN
ncbi:hypothetical protein TpMuguga_01g01213 [Theileria parva strain Muguga]|uniref:U3 small nucleolar RNA-associated protein 25 n=1 Tax=Theileria parva TaxID=5875 RepID=Q4N6F7_THEPA|nr:uncharacterized protein TpMuguga_01g01213 [Theileria parva strain Muguga]EAN34451.1 hypothetical protein TpMuguga_01g01213 [Theileria parva strain Muguga]|eukprot:XP_766734.1 hypothetical protein [Theileria parva strain Muguga]